MACAQHAASIERSRPSVRRVEPIEPGIGVRLQDAGIAVEMTFGMLAGPIARVVEHRRRRVAPAERPVVAHIDPGPTGRGLALGQHRHGGVVAVHALAGEHMGADQLVERAQQRGAAADLVGERRQAEVDALAGVALRLPVQRLVLPVLLEQHHGEQARAGKAARQHMERRRRLARSSRRPGR